MHQENPPPYSAAAPGMSSPPPPGMAAPPPGIKPSYSSPPYPETQPPTQVIITHGPVVHFGPTPQTLICPSCHAQISTSVQTEPNTKTHLFALILCLFQCYCCCCIPYCVDSCQSQNHYCPNCQAFLGSYQN
jgi:lipopolysaccharide-induced tumor necrosis factor-alpha factor